MLYSFTTRALRSTFHPSFHLGVISSSYCLSPGYYHVKHLSTSICHLLGYNKPNLMATPAYTEPTNREDMYAMSVNDSFLQGNSASYIDEMYLQWKKDPSSVHSSWQAYFKNMESGSMPISQAFQLPLSPSGAVTPLSDSRPVLIAPDMGVSSAGSSHIMNYLKVQLLVRAYQVRGHHKAKIDPLGIMEISKQCGHFAPPELDYRNYQFTQSDLNQEFILGPGILPRFKTAGREKMTLGDIINACEKLYCGSYGIEYVHISDREQCDWLRDRIEVPVPYAYSTDEKRRILDRLIWGTSFEQFLATKHPNDKRFGLEGGEALIPGMKAMIDRSVDHGVQSIVIGMPHRGRLNVLSNVVRKPNESIFSEFDGTADPSDEGSGDVKYHLGMNFDRPTPSGKRVHLSLVANPSHLEAEDPVVLGKTRAILHYNRDEKEARTAMAVLLHGDAAFAGQGIVYETMGFHTLPSYHSGGTIHLIVNNQIGFTTDPRFARSTPYCSDIAKSLDAPVFHVNGDDPEAVNFVCQLAADWRARFHKECVIDMVCYRKQGHNETDQPFFTQPLMYKRIAQQRPTLDKYVEKLILEKTFTKQDIDEHKKWVWNTLEESFKKSKDYKATSKEWLSSAWHGFKSPKEVATQVLPHLPTGVDNETLKHIAKTISTVPPGFTVHKNLSRILQGRNKTVETGKDIDMATGEALAFGSLCLEKYHIRVSGQDVERGTFSQRHAVLHDQENENTYTPLQHLSPDQGSFVISNSSLSEFGVLGFEYGYSLSSPHTLVIWEAQFGDFANNAQCIIDQFIASGETKWLQRTGLVVSLPHGYDGQGPEHSSGRIERFLQLCNEDPRIFPDPDKLLRQHQDCNMQIAYCTQPSNVFHLLRRQMHRQFRKPLILFFSKSLLRHPLARSSIRQFLPSSHFEWLIPELLHEPLDTSTSLPSPSPAEASVKIAPPAETHRLILCTGQVYTALVKFRETTLANIPSPETSDDPLVQQSYHSAIIRIEQLHPFPWQRLLELFKKYAASPNLETIVWCQEEPLNAGPWSFIEPRIRTILDHMRRNHESENHALEFPQLLKITSAVYAGRPPSASVATGLKAMHKREEADLLHQAFSNENQSVLPSR